jgi:eukaryotic-like serine/threonine-protein kinase
MGGGAFDVYRQAIDAHSPEKLTSGPDDKWAPQLSPDGGWILYLSWPKAAAGAEPPPGRLMRIPAAGGPSEFVADLKGHPLVGSTYGGFPSFRCPRAGADCILAEQSGEKEITFTALDPSAGRKNEITKFSGEPRFLDWNVSPDGSQIAVSAFDYKTGDIQIVPVKGGAPQKISLLPWQELGPIAWAPDGKSFFIGSYSSRGSSLLRVDPGKPPTLLWKTAWDTDTLAPAPDGRYLAIGPDIIDANAWIIPNFPPH